MKRLSKALLYVPILIAIFLVGQIVADKVAVNAASSELSFQQLQQHTSSLYKKTFSLTDLAIVTMLCQETPKVIEITAPTLVAEIEELDINLLTASNAYFCLLLLFSNYLVTSNIKYKTPKKIINLVSIVHSWIKPIKGCPS